MDAALKQLRADDFEVRDEHVARLSPLLYEHINMLGQYSFSVPDAVASASCVRCAIQRAMSRSVSRDMDRNAQQDRHAGRRACRYKMPKPGLPPDFLRFP